MRPEAHIRVATLGIEPRRGQIQPWRRKRSNYSLSSGASLGLGAVVDVLAPSASASASSWA